MKKKLGFGSISLLLVVIALIWSCTVNGFCLGDYVLAQIGLTGWSAGTFRTHYTVFLGLILYIPAFILGQRYNHHLFAQSGKWISGCIGGCLIVMGLAIMIWG